MRARIGSFLMMLAVAIIGVSAAPPVASADTTVVIGAGVPVYPEHLRHHHYRHHYRPAPVVVYEAPPPAVVYQPPVVYPPLVVYPPPAVVYQPAPGAGLSATPASPIYTARNGQSCREYQTTVMVDGVQQPAHGTACRQPDGSWRTVN